jgi:hypothetical protein
MSSLLSGGPKAAPILVHIDMKGGPPTLDYLLQLLPLLKSWGATGILIEWEDMFPYWGTLKVPDIYFLSYNTLRTEYSRITSHNIYRNETWAG